jgi:hypothetical protein
MHRYGRIFINKEDSDEKKVEIVMKPCLKQKLRTIYQLTIIIPQVVGNPIAFRKSLISGSSEIRPPTFLFRI